MCEYIENTRPDGVLHPGWCVAMIKMPAVLIVHRISIKIRKYLMEIYEE